MARKKEYYEVKLMYSTSEVRNAVKQVVAVDTGHAHTTDETCTMLLGMIAETLPAIIAGNHHLIPNRAKPAETKLSIIINRMEYSNYGK